MKDLARHPTRANRRPETSRRALLAVVLLLGALAIPLTHARTTPVGEETKILASDADTWGRFGESVAVDNGVIAVGAIEYSPGKRFDPGAVFVYSPDGTGGYTETKLTSSDPLAHRVGFSVDIDDGRILTGAYTTNNSTGAAYLFEPDGLGGYTETKFTASDGGPGERYGWDVALDGDNVVVSAYRKDHSGIDWAGVVYVYQPDGNGGWTETNLTYVDSVADRQFGRSVAADNGKILVGAPGHYVDAMLTVGAAYLFEEAAPGNWTATQFLASDRNLRDIYGDDVAMDGDDLLIGAMQSDAAAKNSGAAYLYTLDANGSYVETQFTPSDVEDAEIGENHVYGNAVDLSDGRVLIGARVHDVNGVQDTGQAYLYEQESPMNWTETRFASSSVNQDDSFGNAVAIEGDTMIVSAHLDDDAGTNSGSVFVYEPPTVESTDSTDPAQDDGGTGGDASDDPQDPTPMPTGGMKVYNFTGTMYPIEDTVDAYGIELANGGTDVLNFTIAPPLGYDIALRLIDPNGFEADAANDRGLGGVEHVEAGQNGTPLEDGVWVLVIELVPTPGMANGGELGLPGPGLFDYGGKRRCHPEC